MLGPHQHASALLGLGLNEANNPVTDNANDLLLEGKRKCRDCLLNPNNDGSYFGLYKFIANALVEDNSNSDETLYPCKVVNFYSCPYEIDKDDLFALNQIAEVIGRTLCKALNIKGTRIIYKIDFELGKVQEIDTFLYKDPSIKRVDEFKSDYKPIDYKLDEIIQEIEKLSLIPMNNLDDIFEILTNEEKMETVLQIGLERQYLEHKDELIQFFMSIKGDVRKQDLTYEHLLAHRVDKHRCSVCSQPANICINSNTWICMNDLKKRKMDIERK